MVQTEQAMNRYLVLGMRPWSAWAFTQIQEMPGEWRYCSRAEEVAAVVSTFQPTMIFALHWSAKLPSDIVTRYICINFHMTDVPYGRGGSPLQNLIVRGHRDTMLSALHMTDEMDAGPVYAKRPLSLEGTAEGIYYRAMRVAVGMISQLIPSPCSPVPQAGPVTRFTRRTPDQSRLPVGATLSQLYDHIRMLDAEGYPRAFMEIDGHRYTLSRPTLTDSGLHAEVLIT